MATSADADPWTWGSSIPYLAEKNEDGTAYQFKFLSISGVNYYVQSSEDLNVWIDDTFYRGLGSTITHPLFLLPRNDGDPATPSTEAVLATVHPSLTIREIASDTANSGLLVNWVSLDDNTPKHYTLYGKTLEENAPLLYSRTFGDYQFFIQFFGDPLAPDRIPSSDTLGPKDAAMIAKLLDVLPAINAEIRAGSAAQDSTPPSPPRSGDKKFYRIRQAFTDSDGDQILDHLEAAQGTEMWNWDTDGDGLSDSEDAEPLVNTARQDPDGAGLDVNLEKGLVGRWDFEEASGSSLVDRSGKNWGGSLEHSASSEKVKRDSLGMVSRAIQFKGNNRGWAVLQGKEKSFDDFAVSLWFRMEKGSSDGRLRMLVSAATEAGGPTFISYVASLKIGVSTPAPSGWTPRAASRHGRFPMRWTTDNGITSATAVTARTKARFMSTASTSEKNNSTTGSLRETKRSTLCSARM